MDIKNKIRTQLNTQMSKLTHIEKSKDTSELQGMVSEKTVKINKETIYEMLDEVMEVEGDIGEIRLNPFGSNIKDIEKASEKFIKILGKKFPKLKLKDVQRLVKLFDKVESEIRLVKNKINTDSGDYRDDVMSKVKQDIEEITGAASAGGFLGPLFVSPISRKMPVGGKKSSNKKTYEVKEDEVSEGMMRIGNEQYDNIKVTRRAKGDYTNSQLIADISLAASRANVKVEISYAKTGHGKYTKSGAVSRHWKELAVDISRLQDLNNRREKKLKSHRRNPDGFKTAGDRLCDELEALGYNRNAEGKENPKAVIWYANDGSHKDHLHVSNMEGYQDNDTTEKRDEKRESDFVKQDLTMKDIMDNGDNSELLGKGSTGKGVEEVQQTLLDNGYELSEKGVDGLYGPETKEAVKQFQKDNDLKVDGIVGIETTTAMSSLSEIKKIEAKEATLSSSSGSYETPFFLAKDKKNWRGAAKTLYKGGKFVKVKEKCKKFPYCNQGDINALELFEGGKYSRLADKVAKKMGEDPIKVKSIVLNDIEESLFRERMKETNKKRVEKSEKNNRLPNK